MAKFTTKLRPTDQVAVEVTGNTRLFHDWVAPYVERVVAVNPSQFKVMGTSAIPMISKTLTFTKGTGTVDAGHRST